MQSIYEAKLTGVLRPRTRFKDTVSLVRPPDAFTPHRYGLNHAGGFVGRRRELETLRRWLYDLSGQSSVMVVKALGGMGKSALCWEVFKLECTADRDFEAKIWWSFDEADATLSEFAVQARAYLAECFVSEFDRYAIGENLDAVWNLCNVERRCCVLTVSKGRWSRTRENPTCGRFTICSTRT